MRERERNGQRGNEISKYYHRSSDQAYGRTILISTGQNHCGAGIFTVHACLILIFGHLSRQMRENMCTFANEHAVLYLIFKSGISITRLEVSKGQLNRSAFFFFYHKGRYYNCFFFFFFGIFD